jgi:ABC-2 type transport system permease protein
MADPIGFEVFFSCAMNYLPAVLVFAGLGVFFVGVAPKARMIVWVYTIYAFLVSFLGGMFNMPKWAQNISVFSLLPRYPAEALEPVVTVTLCAAAVALAAIGITGYRHRDITG